jgi:hypothetical protein
VGTSLYDTSAIGSLLQQLTQGGPQVTPSAQPQVPMAGPQAAQIPPQQQVEQHQSLFQRVLSNIKGIPGAISNFERPKLPGEYQAAIDAGLITQQQAEQARPGFLESLVADHQPGGSYGQYRNNLNGVLGIRQLAAGIQQQQATQQTRADIARLFPAQPNETPEQMDARLEAMYAYAVQHGDVELAKNIGDVVKETVKRPNPKSDRGFEPKVFKDPYGNLHFITPGSDIPPGYQQVNTGSAGVPQLFRKPDGSAGWVLPGQDVPKGWKPEVTARTEFVQGNVESRFDTRQVTQGAKDYTAQIKPLRDRAAIIDQALVTLNDAAHNPNPAVRRTLYTSAIANFIQAADQKATVRYQLLQYFKNNVDPSIGGKWEVLKSRLLSGTLPQYSLEAMLAHLGNLRTLTAGEIESQRNDLLKRRPELDGALPETDSFFPATPNAPQSSATPGSTTGKKTVVVNGKTFIVP